MPESSGAPTESLPLPPAASPAHANSNVAVTSSIDPDSVAVVASAGMENATEQVGQPGDISSTATTSSPTAATEPPRRAPRRRWTAPESTLFASLVAQQGTLGANAWHAIAEGLVEQGFARRSESALRERHRIMQERKEAVAEGDKDYKPGERRGWTLTEDATLLALHSLSTAPTPSPPPSSSSAPSSIASSAATTVYRPHAISWTAAKRLFDAGRTTGDLQQRLQALKEREKARGAQGRMRDAGMARLVGEATARIEGAGEGMEGERKKEEEQMGKVGVGSGSEEKGALSPLGAGDPAAEGQGEMVKVDATAASRMPGEPEQAAEDKRASGAEAQGITSEEDTTATQHQQPARRSLAGSPAVGAAQSEPHPTFNPLPDANSGNFASSRPAAQQPPALPPPLISAGLTASDASQSLASGDAPAQPSAQQQQAPAPRSSVSPANGASLGHASSQVAPDSILPAPAPAAQQHQSAPEQQKRKKRTLFASAADLHRDLERLQKVRKVLSDPGAGSVAGMDRVESEAKES
ncbi:uncharacterized protein JCM10292_003847 [Rhodotorula paludigena]|uniref:uncharacterized protein n=1 Tax=Rhodotorula paludigena TaxID=86838 RepID=UPI00316C456B